MMMQPKNSCDWIPLHEEQVKPLAHGKMVLLNGGHYLHHTRSKEIVEGLKAFNQEVKAQADHATMK
jgi:2-hydroxy-6-oxonona-2,4-dienedioate hydrolase